MKRGGDVGAGDDRGVSVGTWIAVQAAEEKVESWLVMEDIAAVVCTQNLEKEGRLCARIGVCGEGELLTDWILHRKFESLFVPGKQKRSHWRFFSRIFFRAEDLHNCPISAREG